MLVKSIRAIVYRTESNKNGMKGGMLMNIKKFIKDIDNVHSQLDNYTHSTYSKTYKFTVWYNKKYGTLTVILDNDDQITGAVLEFYGERVQTMENNTNMKKLAEKIMDSHDLP